MKTLDAVFHPEPNPVSIKFVRHSPGRRRGSDITMYDVSCDTASQAGLVRSTFAKFRRREKPVARPASLENINVHPLVFIVLTLPQIVLVLSLGMHR